MVHASPVPGPLAAVRLGTPTGRAVVAAATLGSGMTLLDGTVVNVALRAIGEDLDAGVRALQWTTNGYLLTLAALILLGGSLGDRFGRRRVFVVGTVLFAVASLLCGLAPDVWTLVAARALQGVGAALLAPGSLAMLQAAFRAEDRARAIGLWSGLGSIAAAVGPFVGGLLVDQLSWRWIFLVNLPLAAATVLLARHVPETRDAERARGADVPGAALATLALAATTYALVEVGSSASALAAVVGLVAGAAFVVAERRARQPMLPLGLFGDRTFSAANAMTLLVYAALGAVLFFLVLQLQTVAGWSALEAGLATLPITVCMLLLAARGGALATRIGPRVPLTAGPLVMAGGVLLLRAAGAETSYVRDVLPGLTVFGLGLALMVAPLTATVLAAAPDRHAGVASGVSNAVARAGTLLAVAALPPLVGLSGADYARPEVMDAGYDAALLACAGLLAAGAVVSWIGVRDVLAPPTLERGGPA
ncbi:MFS transporter [Nocardioides perillae]|uniref:EmrB/QacA subfamily drug resistance transporter n=1 Tax=Nocardioides perillae TaxID=1119534 RepID=A0A7Y9UUX7_9ACTN|nr:EmrB/QacA subfamily drug resistance transporter [Nocardioides perillae]